MGNDWAEKKKNTLKLVIQTVGRMHCAEDVGVGQL